MTNDAFDPELALRTLDRHGVRFVVIGGIAARLLGSPTVTRDTDICYERKPENLERLVSALEELEAMLRGVDEEVPFLLDAKTLAAGDHFTFGTQAGDFDVLGSPAGVEGFDELVQRAKPFDIDGITVLVASIDDLIRMKRAAGRAKDLIEVEVRRCATDREGCTAVDRSYRCRGGRGRKGFSDGRGVAARSVRSSIVTLRVRRHVTSSSH